MGGGIDLNDTSPAGWSPPFYDLDALKQRLADTAADWVPRLFPNGRRQENEWRLADITGRAPRKTGSCVIALAGDKAGSYYDFADGSSGSPMMTVENACGLSDRALFAFAAEICGYASSQNNNGGRAVSVAASPDRDLVPSAPKSGAESEVANILAHSVPAPGTLVETYLASRRLKLPYNNNDLLFNPNVTDWKTKTGWPAMIAIVRGANGQPTGGIHRTYLARDGTGKASLPKPKKMIAADKGSFKGAAVRLSAIGSDGHLGLAEGIETALAASLLHGMPVWAALSAGGIGACSKEGEWTGFEMPTDVAVRKLTIFADAGSAGTKAAQLLVERLNNTVETEIILPSGTDDFAADVAATALQNESRQENVVTTDIHSQDDAATDLVLSINNLSQDSTSKQISDVLRKLAVIRPGQLIKSQNLASIQIRTKKKIGDLKAAYREACRDVIAGEQPASGPAPPWLKFMLISIDGEPKALLENAATALQLAAEWQGVLWYDEFAQKVMARRPPPWSKLNGNFVEYPWTDADDLMACRWLQRAGLPVPLQIVKQATVVVAQGSRYHPVRDYLNGLAWDGVPRLDRWMVDYLGAEDIPYIHGVAVKFMIAAVARIMAPGCKADSMLILEGPQNLGKSTVVRVLFHPWVSEELAEPGSKDAAQQMTGKWGIEFAELDQMRRVEQSRLKAFLSRTEDYYRPPYGYHPIDQPRQTVFIGTVNESTYLDDATGGRRFWPVRCTAIDAGGLFSAKSMLWAEADARYRAGETYYLSEPDLIAEAREQQEERQQVDAWDDLIARHLGGGNAFPFAETTIADLLIAVGLPKDRWARADQIRVGRWLTKHRWQRFKKDVGRGSDGKRMFEWRYRRPES